MKPCFKFHKFLLRKGDQVIVTAGREKGKKGKILKVLPKKAAVVIEGLNLVKRHKKPTQNNNRGEVVTQESPIAVSNVMFFDAKAGQPSRLGVRTEGGQRVRFTKKSGTQVDVRQKA